MAALIATRLAKTICNEFKIKPARVVLWSDSMIVLAWLRSESTAFKSFVGVRVAEIQSTFESATWRHVPSDLNPADDLSRGITVSEMNGRWMNGPVFLTKEPEEWPIETSETPSDVPEVKLRKLLFVLQSKPTAFIDPSRYSNWRRLCRVTAYCFRFIRNTKSHSVSASPLLPEEIESAERYWVKEVQRELGNWKEQYKELPSFKLFV